MAQGSLPPLYAQACEFKVVLGEVEVAGFRSAAGLAVTHEVLEYQEGGVNERHHKLVGAARYHPIVLSWGSSSSTELFDWVKQALDGTIERKNGSVMALDQQGDVILRWDFKEAWPSGYQGPSFTADDSEVAIERLELSHRGFDVLPGGDRTG